jgi:uncharacterized membrane protein
MHETLFHALGFGLCHQLPERSFFAGGFQLPVCARDTGIYIGFALALVTIAVLSRGRRPTELPRWPVLAMIGIFVGVMAIDGITSYAGLRTTTNDIRLITGLITGWGMATITVPMINGQLWTRADAVRIPSGVREVGAWLGMIGVSFAVTRWLLPLLGVGYPLLVSVAIIVTFVGVNLVFVGLIPYFERKARSVRDVWPHVLVALGLTAVELAAAALIRMMVERFA